MDKYLPENPDSTQQTQGGSQLEDNILKLTADFS